MSHLKKSMSSSLLKDKFANLLESLERTNTSRMIIERHFSKVVALEIDEKNSQVKAEVAGLRKPTQVVLAESVAVNGVADTTLLKQIDILESSMKELKAYAWMKSVADFLKESDEYLKRNQVYILIERVIHDLESDKSAKFFKKAIEKLREASESTAPVTELVESLESEKWIPLVKRLYEYASKLKGSVNGENPNFKVSRIYSPVEAIDENTYAFASSGKFLEVSNGILCESDRQMDPTFKALVNIAESAKIDKNGMRIYPNVNSVVDIAFEGSTPNVKLNGAVVEAKDVNSRLLAGGFLKLGETQKSSFILHAIEEGHKIKDIDFGYKVTSSVFEGLSASIYNLNDKIYVQTVNRGMKVNTLIEAQTAEEAVRLVKDFMNYDITSSVSHLLENEKAEADRRQREIAKIESRIKFLMESLADLERKARLNGVEASEHIKKAKSLLEGQIAEQNDALAKFGLVEGTDADGFKPTSKKDIITDFEVGQEYTVDGEPNFTYQGVTDGSHIFNSDKGEKSPKTFSEEEIKSAKIEKM